MPLLFSPLIQQKQQRNIENTKSSFQMFKIKTKKTSSIHTLTSQKRIDLPQNGKTLNIGCNEDVLKTSLNHKPLLNRAQEGRPITANGSKPLKNGGLSHRRGTFGLKHSNSNNFSGNNQKRMSTEYKCKQYSLNQNLYSTIQSIFSQILTHNGKFSNLSCQEREQLDKIKQKIKARSEIIWLKVTIANNKKQSINQQNQQDEQINKVQSTLKTQILKQIQKEKKLVQASSQCQHRVGRIQSMIQNRLQKLTKYSVKTIVIQA